MSPTRKIARDLLAKVALDWMFDGSPTTRAWERFPTLSNSERVIAALAFAIADYHGAALEHRVLVSELMCLDNYQLEAVAAALAAVADCHLGAER